MFFFLRIQSVHYGWIIVGTGAMVVFSCLGLARFGYTMLLPGMQAGLGLSSDRMGLIGTANFVGYLVAVVLTPALLSRFRPRTTITASLLLIALGMFGIGYSNSLAAVAVIYTLVGIGTGFANIPMMVMLTYWFCSDQKGKAAGIVICGNGMGIIFAGFFIPLLNQNHGLEGWRVGWTVLGIISLATAVCAAVLLRNHPSELNLNPVGRPLVGTSNQGWQAQTASKTGSILLRLGLLYFFFGVTFMIYGTFIVNTMVQEYGFSEQRAGFYWSWVGFFSLFSGVGFGALSDAIGRSRGLALVFCVQTAAYLLVGLKFGSTALVVSIVLYGLAVFAIPAIMAASVGDYLGIFKAASAFTTITLFFAVGQAVGPTAAGYLAKASGGFSAAYKMAGFLTAVAAALALTLPHVGDKKL